MACGVRIGWAGDPATKRAGEPYGRPDVNDAGNSDWRGANWQGNDPMMWQKLGVGLAALVTLSACGTLRVDYGKLPHAEYVADNRCMTVTGEGAALKADGLFLVTSRLPDCRGPQIRMLHHRSPQVRYGRFAVPTGWSGNEKKSPVPLEFRTAPTGGVTFP